MDHSQLTTIDILRYRAGVCREFVKLFEEMCQVSFMCQVASNLQGVFFHWYPP